MFRFKAGRIEVLLGRQGGPYYENMTEGHWSIPKGLRDGEELVKDCAIREFREETSFDPPNENSWLYLGIVRSKSAKVYVIWAFEGDCNPQEFQSNTCSIEWPKGSGEKIEIPEIDKMDFFGIEEAKQKIVLSQQPFIDRLKTKLKEKK